MKQAGGDKDKRKGKDMGKDMGKDKGDKKGDGKPKVLKLCDVTDQKSQLICILRAKITSHR